VLQLFDSWSGALAGARAAALVAGALGSDHAAFEGASTGDSGDSSFPRCRAALSRFRNIERGRRLSLDSSLPLDWPRPSCSPSGGAGQSRSDPAVDRRKALDREVDADSRHLGRTIHSSSRSMASCRGDADRHVERLLELVRKGPGLTMPGSPWCCSIWADPTARRRSSLPLQSLQRSGDHPPAAAAALGPSATDLTPAGPGGTRDLCPSRRAARRCCQYPGPGRSAGAGAADSGSEAKVFIAHAYWSPLSARRGAGGGGLWPRRKSCRCSPWASAPYSRRRPRIDCRWVWRRTAGEGAAARFRRAIGRHLPRARLRAATSKRMAMKTFASIRVCKRLPPAARLAWVLAARPSRREMGIDRACHRGRPA